MLSVDRPCELEASSRSKAAAATPGDDDGVQRTVGVVPGRVTPLPHGDEPAEELTGDEEWLSTLDDPYDTTTTTGDHPHGQED